MRRAISCVSGAFSFCKAIESGAIFWTRTVGADEQLETSGLSGAVDIGALDFGAGLTSVCAKRTLGLGGFRCRVVGHRAIELDAVGTRRADVGEEFGQEAKLWKTTSALDVAFSIVVAPSLASRQRFLSKPVGFSTSLRNGGKFIKKKTKAKKHGTESSPLSPIAKESASESTSSANGERSGCEWSEWAWSEWAWTEWAWSG